MRPGSNAGWRRHRRRRSSSPTRTSAPASASNRWRRGSGHGSAATRLRLGPGERAAAGRSRRSEPCGAGPRRSSYWSASWLGSLPRKFAGCPGPGAPCDPRGAVDVATGPTAPLRYYWLDDSYSVGHGPDALAARLAGDGPPLERMRLTGATTSADEIAERVATATLFGGGTLVVVAEPAPLIATKPLAARLVETLGAVATGNGLAFLDTVDGTARRPASLETLRNAVAAAGGEVREFKAPTRDQMARWIADRARERGINISSPAAALLAERVGANVRERDIDRRRQGELAVAPPV